MNKALSAVCLDLAPSLWSGRDQGAGTCKGLDVADIFDEVNEDLRADRAKQFALRYGWLAALLAVLLIGGAGAWQAWRWQQARQVNEVATAYLGAMRDADGPAPTEGQPTPRRNAAMAEFDRLANTGPEGYRSLARLRSAALRASNGDLPGALAEWDKLAADTAAEPLLRGLANLMWVQHQVDSGDPAAVEGRLQPLVAPNSPWRHLALENQAWLALRLGQTDQARDTLRQLAADPTAPDGMRGRANGLLARLGGPAPAAGPSPAASSTEPRG